MTEGREASSEAKSALALIRVLQGVIDTQARELAGARRLAVTGLGVATTALGIAGAMAMRCM